ncbi:hypothetical protein AX769_22430 (plasmid) [Frondihabitans sp. PAMC 28766]|nr:hypothetical protein AX769_22430 [Frondihabitans sp. PAMC 28766]
MIVCPCGDSQTLTVWVVLDCAVTAVLGTYSTEDAAIAAADGFGSCSFPYLLSEVERVALLAAS